MIVGLLIPFLGTTIGAGMVFLMKNKMSKGIEKILLGVAAGVMVAASVWSLLIPSIDMAKNNWVPATVGFFLGVIFLYLFNKTILYLNTNKKIKTHPTTLMAFAVTLHNIPEGMAVGVAIAGALSSSSPVTMTEAIALAIGIGIQNFPEGAIISMPLKKHGKGKAFLIGMLSGIVEPIGGIITILLTSLVVPILPYLLAFAAGAMIYVVVKELIPESQDDKNKDLGVLGFSIGFIIMMILDVTLG